MRSGSHLFGLWDPQKGSICLLVLESVAGIAAELLDNAFNPNTSCDQKSNWSLSSVIDFGRLTNN